MLNSILSSVRLNHVLSERPSDIPLAKESMRHCRHRSVLPPTCNRNSFHQYSDSASLTCDSPSLTRPSNRAFSVLTTSMLTGGVRSSLQHLSLHTLVSLLLGGSVCSILTRIQACSDIARTIFEAQPCSLLVSV